MSQQAKIHIDRHTPIGRVSDYLYGANLEHIGQSIYGGIWAEMLRDRKFAGHDHMYTGPSEGLYNAHPSIGVVVPWEAYKPDDGCVRFHHDNSVYYTGRQSQRITIRQVDGQFHGIQQGSLYLEAGEYYSLRLVLRGEGQPVRISLGAQTWTIDAVAVEWTTYEHRFHAEASDPHGRLVIAFAELGQLWVGCASLMPGSNVSGFRADVLDALKDWGPTFLRWPGGNFVSAYHWQEAIGDRDRRAAYLDSAWHLWESNDVGIDEFMELCRILDTEPVLTINMGNGTVEEAAAWVEYCNGAANTPYGAMRAANGSAEPYQVRVWFVGNEQFGNWQEGHVDAETYARAYDVYARAMRAVDPDLTLIAVGVPTDLYGHWNEDVLRTITEQIDQFSVHYYSIRTEKWQVRPADELLYLPKIAAAHEVAMMVDETIAIMDRYSKQGQLPIAFDEWNTYSGAKAPDYIDNYNLADALYTGALMNACIERCDRIHLSAIYHLINPMGSYLVTPLYKWEEVNLGRGGAWVPVSTGESPAEPAVIKVPSTLVMELMTRYRGSLGLACTIESPMFDSPEAGNLPEQFGIPCIDASATYDEASGQIYLSVVNRDVNNPIRLGLMGLGQLPQQVQAYIVTGETPLSTNTPQQPHAVSITEQTLAGDALVIPPHSYMMCVIAAS